MISVGKLRKPLISRPVFVGFKAAIGFSVFEYSEKSRSPIQPHLINLSVNKTNRFNRRIDKSGENADLILSQIILESIFRIFESHICEWKTLDWAIHFYLRKEVQTRFYLLLNSRQIKNIFLNFYKYAYILIKLTVKIENDTEKLLIIYSRKQLIHKYEVLIFFFSNNLQGLLIFIV